jgi:hypothetical protein
LMKWGHVKRYMVDAIARLSSGIGRASQETADALEQCPRLADEVKRSRAVHADVRNRLDQAERAWPPCGRPSRRSRPRTAGAKGGGAGCEATTPSCAGRWTG